MKKSIDVAKRFIRFTYTNMGIYKCLVLWSRACIKILHDHQYNGSRKHKNTTKLIKQFVAFRAIGLIQ